MFAILMNLKTLFLSKLFIFLCQDFVNNNGVYSGVVVLGFVGLSLINISISVVFYWSFVSGYCVRFDLWRGALAASPSVGSLISSSVGSLVNSSVSSLVNS